jgi:hypothetical protein
MHQRIWRHMRANVVAYLALFLAAGGGYAIAAGRSTTIHGCVSRDGTLHVLKRCPHGTTRLVWNQQGQQGKQGSVGPAAITAFGVVNYDGTVSLGQSQGIAAQRTATGTYQVTITACTKHANAPTVTVTQAGNPGALPPPAGSVPVGWIEDTSTDVQFTVHTGFLSSGAFTAADLRFDVQDSCFSSGS